MSDEKRYKIISASVSTVVSILVLLFLLFCGFKYQNPPPPPKKVILIELSELGGGGGGGNEAVSNTKSQPTASENITTQNNDDTPEVYSNPNVKKNANNNASINTPKPDQNAIFRPGMGGGSGGGTGSGTGPGTGSGIGPGTGSGSGGGIGYGYGNRGMVKIPDMTIKEDGKVYVEVHVSEDGSVLDAKIISTPKYPTSITSSTIRNECIQRAKQAKYVKGKEELRIIVFEP